MPTLARSVLSLTAALALVGHPTTRIPAGVRTIDLDARTTQVRVTDRAEVARIVGWIDRLQIARPRIYACPAMVAHPRTLTLDFRDAGGHLVARATYRFAFGDRTLLSGPCNPILLRVPGHRQRALLGNRFLLRVERLLGIGLR